MQLQFGCIGERLAASSMYWRAACSQSHFHAAMHLYLEMFMARFFVLEASHRNKLWKFLFFFNRSHELGLRIVMAIPEMRVRLLRKPAGIEPVESGTPHGNQVLVFLHA